MRLLVFDLDGTLAELGKEISASDVALLKWLRSRGDRIAVCSGKPTYYLCGFMRQAGLEDAILIGENGAETVFGVDLPPKQRLVTPSHGNLANIEKIKSWCTEHFAGKVWYQPNNICFTPFPNSQADFDDIDAFLAANPELLDGVDYYKHCDSYDFVPAGVSKYTGLECLCKYLNIDRKDVVAIGDGVNDYPMFDFAGLSIGIGTNLQFDGKTDMSFLSISAALAYLLQNEEN